MEHLKKFEIFLLHPGKSEFYVSEIPINFGPETFKSMENANGLSLRLKLQKILFPFSFEFRDEHEMIFSFAFLQ